MYFPRCEQSRLGTELVRTVSTPLQVRQLRHQENSVRQLNSQELEFVRCKKVALVSFDACFIIM